MQMTMQSLAALALTLCAAVSVSAADKTGAVVEPLPMVRPCPPLLLAGSRPHEINCRGVY